MAQFKYPFQKILDLKENEKEFAQIQMADAIKLQEERQRKNEELYNKIVEAEKLKKQKQQDGMNILELRMFQNYINELQSQLMAAQRELEFMENNVLRKQTHLRKTVQEEKTWINLKEQQKTQFKEQEKISEQIHFDEMASTRFYRVSKL